MKQKTNQKELLRDLLIEFCNEEGSRTFSMQQLIKVYKDFSIINIGGKTPDATIRKLLQKLRDENFLSFIDNSGTYTLRGVELLEKEKEELKNITISSDEEPNKIEYIRETYIRNSKLVIEARERFSSKCFIPQCNNTFLTPKKIPYIEVHHIIPLFEGGEDALWNLSTLCAHHHKMAHFAEKKVVTSLQSELLDINKFILEQ